MSCSRGYLATGLGRRRIRLGVRANSTRRELDADRRSAGPIVEHRLLTFHEHRQLAAYRRPDLLSPRTRVLNQYSEEYRYICTTKCGKCRINTLVPPPANRRLPCFPRPRTPALRLVPRTAPLLVPPHRRPKTLPIARDASGPPGLPAFRALKAGEPALSLGGGTSKLPNWHGVLAAPKN